MISTINGGQQAKIDGIRRFGVTTAIRTRKPAARSRTTKPRRKASKRSKREPYLPIRMIPRLRELAQATNDRRAKAILWILIDSGLRPWELVGLSRGQIRVRMIEQPDGAVRTEAAGSLTRPRAEYGRRFVIGQEAVDALRDYMNLNRVRGDNPALFTDHGERMTTAALMALIDDWIRQAKNLAD
jgi:integrase